MERNLSLNPMQLHLLKMFSYAKTEKDLDEIRQALSIYFADRTEKEMDSLWNDGQWDKDKNEEILREHLRTPYHD